MTIKTEQLKQILAEYAKVTEAEANAFVDSLIETLLLHLKHGEEVEVNGLGVFYIVESQQGRRVAFRAEDKLKESVNAPFSFFEPVIISEPSLDAMAAEAIVKTTPEPESVCETSQDSVPEPSPVLSPVAETVEEEIVHYVETIDEMSENAKPEPVPVTLNTKQRWNQGIDIEKEPLNVDLGTPKGAEVSMMNLGWVISILAVLAIGGALLFYVYMQGNAKKGVVVAEEYVPIKKSVVDEAVTPASPDLSAMAKVDSTMVKDSIMMADSAMLAADTLQKIASEPTENMLAVSFDPDKGAGVMSEEKEETKKESEPVNGRPTDKMIMHNPDGTPMTVKLKEGERLTILSDRIYGDKYFWGYIYEVNAFQIPNPNMVPSYLNLYLPDPTYFCIDANDPESVRRGKQKHREIISSLEQN